MYYRHNYSSSNRTEVFVYLLGKPLKEKDAITKTDTAVLTALGYNDFRNIKKYLRIQIRDIQFNSCDWNKSNSQRNNATIAYYYEDKIQYGNIQCFFHDSEQSLVFCMQAKLSPCDAPFGISSSSTIPHIVACVPQNHLSEMIAVPIANIISPCVQICFSDVVDCVCGHACKHIRKRLDYASIVIICIQCVFLYLKLW